MRGLGPLAVREASRRKCGGWSPGSLIQCGCSLGVEVSLLHATAKIKEAKSGASA